MKKRFRLILVCTFIMLFLVGCSVKYNIDDFIGKTSAEIVSEFGSFDCTTMPADSDGLYRNCRCGYTIKEAQKNFLGSSEEILFFVVFDENGIAIECEEGYRPAD